MRFNADEFYMSLIEEGLVSLPSRSTEESAGYDCYFISRNPLEIGIGEEVVIDLHLTVEKGFSTEEEIENKNILIYPRSSLALKKGLYLKGDIKSYKFGEKLLITLKNLSDKVVKLESGDKIVQVIVRDAGAYIDAKEVERGFVKKFDWLEYPKDRFNGSFILFQVLDDTTLDVGVPKLVPTGLKVKLESGTYLELELSQNLVSDYPVFQANTKGVVDADYYENPSNDGHIQFPILNYGYLKVNLKRGIVLGYGTIYNYYLMEDDLQKDLKVKRESGFGSTGEK